MTTFKTAQIETPTPDPARGTPEYDALMIARADAGMGDIRVTPKAEADNQPPSVIVHQRAPEKTQAEKDADAAAAAAAAKPQRPANVPEKFWNAETGTVNTEALLKSYGELESGKGRAPAATPASPAPAPKVEPTVEQKAAAATVTEATAAVAAAKTPEEKTAAEAKLAEANTAKTAADTAADTAAKAAAVPGLAETLQKASAEFATDQKMSDATYDALAKNGITREYADAYVDGLKARAEVITNKVYAEVGGQERYVEIQTWAAENLTPEQQTAANTAFAGGDLNTVIGAVRTLKSLYEAKNGVQGNPIVPVNNGGGGAGASPYKNQSEVTKDMSDPRYKADANFRAEVAKRMSASIAAGVDLGF